MNTVEEDWHIQSFAWKWSNEDTIHCLALCDFPLYKKQPHNDVELVKKLHSLFSQADIVIAHNGLAFDIKRSNSRFLVHGLRPPRPYKTVDTLKVARRYFGFFGNSLDELARIFKLGRKEEKGVKELWKKCYDGDRKAWIAMKRYNKMDVELLEGIYRKMLPYINPFPRVRMDNGKCPKCSSTSFKKNGMKYGKNWECQRYACLECGDGNIYGETIRH